MTRNTRKSYCTVICKTIDGAHMGQETIVHSGSNDPLAGWKFVYPLFHGMAFALYEGEVTVVVREVRGESKNGPVVHSQRFRFGGGKWVQVGVAQ